MYGLYVVHTQYASYCVYHVLLLLLTLPVPIQYCCLLQHGTMLCCAACCLLFAAVAAFCHRRLPNCERQFRFCVLCSAFCTFAVLSRDGICDPRDPPVTTAGFLREKLFKIFILFFVVRVVHPFSGGLWRLELPTLLLAAATAASQNHTSQSTSRRASAPAHRTTRVRHRCEESSKENIYLLLRNLFPPPFRLSHDSYIGFWSLVIYLCKMSGICYQFQKGKFI